MKRVLITGGTGFIGRTLLQRIIYDGEFIPIVAIRTRINSVLPVDQVINVGEISSNTNWKDALCDVKVVIHAAARAHVLDEKSLNPIESFREVNVDGTLNLARQAVERGVTRFIFISSIGVNGNHSIRPFTEDDIPNPVEPYALSKLEAEQGLRQIADETGMEVVIIRPPLVYGPNSPGNFRRLFEIIKKKIPLPLGAIHNKRSLIGLDTLVDFIIVCVDNSLAANETFLVSDGEDLSTTELIQTIAKALNISIYLVPVPEKILRLGAMLVGKQAFLQRLCGSLQVDISKARKLLDWKPILSVEEGMARAVKGARTKNNLQ